MITRVVNEEVAANTYVCATSIPGAALVVDPGLSTTAIEAELERRRLVARWVLLTHGHFDHLGSAAALQERGAQVVMHGADRRIARSANFLMMACRLERRVEVPRIDLEAQDGTEVVIGDEVARFRHTPGHTPGSCCIAWRHVLFTGDTIYRHGVGHDGFPGEDAEQLRASVRALRLPDGALLLPGHGGLTRWGDVRALAEAA